MYLLRLILKNALRHKLRTALTVLGLFIATLAFETAPVPGDATGTGGE